MNPCDLEKRTERVGECLVWKGSRSRKGYGRVYIDGTRRKWPAHRVMFERENGPIPNGMFVCHSCDNPPCINPDHLFLGDACDNMRDASRKGRLTGPRGERAPAAKLKTDQVLTIRARWAGGEPRKVLAAEYGVDHRTIWRIVKRRAWAHV